MWDCGIDGVETDLSLCLTHGASAAAIPTVRREAIEINGTGTRKESGEEERKRGGGGDGIAFKKEQNPLHSACQFVLS